MSNTKKYTVKDFCKKYNGLNTTEEKLEFIKNMMNSNYVPYEMKITICERIVEKSYYKTSEKNGIKVKKLHVDSTVKYMLYCLNLVRQYTNIDIDFKNSLEEFNLLNGCGVLDAIYSEIQEKELKEFRMILDMVENDVIQNEYETHAFIANQIERFGELFGSITKPALNRLSEVIENMDDKTIEKIVNKFNGKGLNELKKNLMS